MGAYFKALRAISVAVLGSNNKNIFRRDTPTLIEDEGDIYIYRKKDNLYECDAEGNALNQGSGPQVSRAAPPLSRDVYHGLDGAKRRQIQAENTMRENERARKEAEASAVEDKKDINDELSSEDDLDVEDDDFDFEEDDEEEEKTVEQPKPKKSKPKKKVSKDKKVTTKKTAKASKKTKSKKKPDKKKKSDHKKKKDILSRFKE